ncbi:hypothetical protein ACOME3_002989 [Neoechinorhynchus agilis]
MKNLKSHCECLSTSYQALEQIFQDNAVFGDIRTLNAANIRYLDPQDIGRAASGASMCAFSLKRLGGTVLPMFNLLKNDDGTVESRKIKIAVQSVVERFLNGNSSNRKRV